MANIMDRYWFSGQLTSDCAQVQFVEAREAKEDPRQDLSKVAKADSVSQDLDF